MSTPSETTDIYGAIIEAMDNTACQTWLKWLIGQGKAPENTFGVLFALAHCDAGVTWGKLDNEQQWRLSAEVDPALSPIPCAQTLHELRLFGKSVEVLIWRTDDGLRGRVLIDRPADVAQDNPLAPLYEPRFLRGETKGPQNGFSLYVDRGGAQHLSPSNFPNEFSVCHYLEEDSLTGAVRIAVTRLVSEKQS